MTPLPVMSTISQPQQAAALLDTTRLRLLRELAIPEGDTAAGLSRRVGIKRQLVNYHLRELEKAGLVEVLEENRRGAATERVVRATAKSFLIDPAVMGDLAADPDRVPDRFSSAYLIAVAAKAISEVATLRQRAADAGKPLPTISLQSHVRFATAEDRHAFAEDLANEIAKLIAEYHDESSPGGRWHSFFVGGYPTITKDAAGADLPLVMTPGVDSPFGRRPAPPDGSGERSLREDGSRGSTDDDRRASGGRP